MTSVIISDLFKDLALGDAPANLVELTKREVEILKLLVDGMSYKCVSFRLHIALDTVRSHTKKIYEKLRVNSKSEAVAKALKERIVVTSMRSSILA